MRRLLALVLGLAAGTIAIRGILLPWWRTWGRRTEDDAPLPGDDLVADATGVETRGIDIAAPPEAVWPWLAQMGYGRAGWYSYDALDMDRPSLDRVDPSLARVKVGDILPTHASGGFEVKVVDPPHALVVYTDTDLVTRQAAEADASADAGDSVNVRATGAFMQAAQPTDFVASWAFIVQPRPGGTSRLIERFRVRFGQGDRPWHRFSMPLMGFGVFVMMRKQMLGIRDRAERTARPPAESAVEHGRVEEPVA
jgi:hypothetical protein